MIWKTQTHWQKGKFFKQSYFPLSLTFTRMKIWLTLCVTWLCPSIGLTFLDIFFDSLLAIEYYAQWQNVTYVNKSIERFVLLIIIKHSLIIIDVRSVEKYLEVLSSTPPDLPFIVLSIALLQKPGWVIRFSSYFFQLSFISVSFLH